MTGKCGTKLITCDSVWQKWQEGPKVCDQNDPFLKFYFTNRFCKIEYHKSQYNFYKIGLTF